MACIGTVLPLRLPLPLPFLLPLLLRKECTICRYGCGLQRTYLVLRFSHTF
jgi:hypothetical protein